MRVRLVCIGLCIITLSACAAPTSRDSAATVDAVYARITEQAQSGEPLDPVLATSEAGEVAEAEESSDEATPEPENTPTPTPTPPDFRTSPLSLPRCTVDLTIDAQRSDWALEAAASLNISLEANTFGPSNWDGTQDSSGIVQLCWTDDDLFLFATVTDDRHVQTQSGLTAWQGDEIELVFDSNLRGDFFDEVWDDDDTQIGLSPGDFISRDPSGVRYQPQGQENLPVDIVAIREFGEGGSYDLEAQVPWSVFSTNPQSGESYGLCIAISDNDQPGEALQQSMVSHCQGLIITDPTTWITITLTG
ncbi:MAG: hypothetical protein GYB68_10920 [Chloroflexi bacterium]|nr:hypothetical protein [Chloroflexota bacterium]